MVGEEGKRKHPSCEQLESQRKGGKQTRGGEKKINQRLWRRMAFGC